MLQRLVSLRYLLPLATAAGIFLLTSTAGAAKPELRLFGGGGLQVAIPHGGNNVVASPLGMLGAHLYIGDRHALVVGGDVGFAYYDAIYPYQGFGQFGLSVGYRVRLTDPGDLRFSLFALAQPGVWAGKWANGSPYRADVAVSLGGALGPQLIYKRLSIDLPISLARVASVENHFNMGASTPQLVNVGATVQVGVIF